jgi:hypothetical protein
MSDKQLAMVLSGIVVALLVLAGSAIASVVALIVTLHAIDIIQRLLAGTGKR